MTLTDPAGDPDLLRTVVASEHDRLASLLAEASRKTATPGVEAALWAQLVHELRDHLQVEQNVLGPQVAAHLEVDEARELADDADALVALGEDARARGEHEDLADGLADHAARVDEALQRLGGALGDSAMARLAHDYGQAAEAALGT